MIRPKRSPDACVNGSIPGLPSDVPNRPYRCHQPTSAVAAPNPISAASHGHTAGANGPWLWSAASSSAFASMAAARWWLETARFTARCVAGG
ncbi:hypothetical protein GCM10023321_73140 [Pseudonocardia eucalypti]|uniref:Uncharacterized protein n=1 Tax=Pseudonocardia eucalypti TaxID=648755 RepID=A0ABP9R7S3_9PSEU